MCGSNESHLPIGTGFNKKKKKKSEKLLGNQRRAEHPPSHTHSSRKFCPLVYEQRQMKRNQLAADTYNN
jgi:hypothetical protein